MLENKYKLQVMFSNKNSQFTCFPTCRFDIQASNRKQSSLQLGGGEWMEKYNETDIR